LVSKFAATALLPQWFGYPGISAATTISQVGFAILLLILVVRRSQMKDWGRLTGNLLKIILAGLIALAVGHMFDRFIIAGTFGGFTRSDSFIKICLNGLIILVVYGLLVYLMGFGEYIKSILRLKSSDKDQVN